VTAIQLLPVAAFAGAHNWGYDGVLPFAPAASYGHPDELKDLIQTAHHKGMMVLLDLACHYFGPEGNYLHLYAPAFFATGATGLAGRSIDAANPVVREFIIHNALYWLEEFHLDGLRLNAALLQEQAGQSELLEALARAVREGPGKTVIAICCSVMTSVPRAISIGMITARHAATKRSGMTPLSRPCRRY
jgi:maltooligosyltrehalose trehalohydrolase